MEFYVLLGIVLLNFVISDGCQIEGINLDLPFPQSIDIQDTDRGILFSRTASDIASIRSWSYSESIRGNNYLTVDFRDGTFFIETDTEFDNYEEVEIEQTIGLTVVLQCTGTSDRNLVFQINIEDTNNHAPVFLPSDNYEFVIAPPVPPGFLLTGCNQDIIARDVDLTTQRVEFAVEDNPYFQITYDAASSTTEKEFKAILNTTTYIRSLPEPMTFRISATDVHGTGTISQTSYATITITADRTFELPDEPVFSNAYYLAEYSNNQVVMSETIYLTQGYDELVYFSLDDRYSEYFSLNVTGNEVTVISSTVLPNELLYEKQLYLIVNAERELTAGASATVIVQLPEEEGLQYENSVYEGRIVDNSLELTNLVLRQGFEDAIVNVTIVHEHSSYFSTTVQGNQIQITMEPLETSIINDNIFLTLEVVASTDRSEDSTIVILEIVKNDVTTPYFEKSLYEGSFDISSGLVLEDIVIVQGFDATLSVTLEGDDSVLQYFSIVDEGPIVRLSTNLTAEELPDQNLVFALRATKPRTVGATTGISINLPEKTSELRILRFGQNSYEGRIVNGSLNLPSITLIAENLNDVQLNLTGDYRDYFTYTVTNGDTITIQLNEDQELPADARVVALSMEATSENAITGFTVIVIDVSTYDETVITPVFEQAFYSGEYSEQGGLLFNHYLTLIQGFDESVTLNLDGDDAEWFDIIESGNNNFTIALKNLDTIQFSNEKSLVFTVVAIKPGSVDGKTIIIISLTDVSEFEILQFEQNSYLGRIVDGTLNLSPIILLEENLESVQLELIGEYTEYFSYTINEDNSIAIQISQELPTDVGILTLTLEASRENAVSGFTVIVIEVVSDSETIITPVFEQAFYSGEYSEQGGLLFNNYIALIQGFDASVTFNLDGVDSQWFNIMEISPNNFTLVRNNQESIQFSNEKALVFTVVAAKAGSVDGKSTVVIYLTDVSEYEILQFERNSYLGRIVDGTLNLLPIILSEENFEGVQLELIGEYTEYFFYTINDDNSIAIQISQELPTDVGILTLTLEASRENAVSGFTVIVIEVVSDSETIVTPVFEQAFYSGEYLEQEGLLFNNYIALIQGFDASVIFNLDGEDAQWFNIMEISPNNFTLVRNNQDSIQFSNEKALVFTVVATKAGSVDGKSTVVIYLTDTTELLTLHFEQNSYMGRIVDGSLNLSPIVLVAEDLQSVQFEIIGEYREYFTTTINNDNTVGIQLTEELPLNARILTLTLEASRDNAIGSTVIVIEVVTETETVITPVFEQALYSGEYSEQEGLVFDHHLRLVQGFDGTVIFNLEGDDAEWFDIIENGQNNVTLALKTLDSLQFSNDKALVFTVVATKPRSVSGKSTIIINLTDIEEVLEFSQIYYTGSIEENRVTAETITLRQGNSHDVNFTLSGDYAEYFQLDNDGEQIALAMEDQLPNIASSEDIIILTLTAQNDRSKADTTIILQIVRDEINNVIAFEELYYIGSYSNIDGLDFDIIFNIKEPFEGPISYTLSGTNSQWFELHVVGNTATLGILTPISDSVLINNQQIVFTIKASDSSNATAESVIIISFEEDNTSISTILAFEKTYYQGSINISGIILEPINLAEDFNENITFELIGDLAAYFEILNTIPILIELKDEIQIENLLTRNTIILELQATAPEALAAYTTIIFEVDQEDSISLEFDKTYYIGQYEYSEEETFIFNEDIQLINGLDDTVQFKLEGENHQYFILEIERNNITLKLNSAISIPPATILNNQNFVFAIIAERNNISTSAAIVINIIKEDAANLTLLGFENINYIGTIEGNNASISDIILSEGYTQDVTFSLNSGLYLEEYFSVLNDGPVVFITLLEAIPDSVLLSTNVIVLELRASAPDSVSAYTTIIFETIKESEITPTSLTFNKAYYTGYYNDLEGLTFEDTISLIEGYDNSVQFILEGEYSEYFDFERNGNSLNLIRSSTTIPSTVLETNRHFTLSITATNSEAITAIAPIIITIVTDNQLETNIEFDKVLYEGTVVENIVQHETITIRGYDSSVIDISGDYADFFEAYSGNGNVVVNIKESASLPNDVTVIVLELQATNASCVLVLSIETAQPGLPSIEFTSPLYVVNVDVTTTGVIGRVSAAASNGEDAQYSLILDSAHLQERLSVDNEGDLLLSAPANTGVYSFGVIATTVTSQVQASAQVSLTVDAVTVCNDSIVVPPLIILEIEEEQPHENIVYLNPTEYPGCQYILSNRWPEDQSWLYTDENGLQSTAIDREHSSIAFMHASQIQVELILQCDNDVTESRSKRSITDSYDYGTNKWVLTDSIQYNSKRSIVNIIVNDINDNAPVFVGKENEPIIVGYPENELKQIILPRALVELQAMDADIGENAELWYWSDENAIAVSPKTGFVHVRDTAELENDMSLTIYVTDRNGQGLTSDIDILVKSLDKDYIAVITVRDAFLEDERNILNNLTSSLGYDVKVLRSVVISNDFETDDDDDNYRKKRNTNTAGASLQLFIYGLFEREPVHVSKLRADINNNVMAAVNVANTVSLEDYLETPETWQDDDNIGLLVSTIVLAVLLFLIIVAAAIYGFILWRNNRNYSKFSDENSIASRNESVDQFGKQSPVPKTRLNIEDLIRSEKRLKEMLETPIEAPEKPNESNPQTIIQVPPETNNLPIVIQSIDKLNDADDQSDEEDEFGETKTRARKKSVVTFNENVEKIIHVDDTNDSDTNSVEIYKL